MENVASEEEKRQEQLDFLKSQKTCSNCVHRQVCTIVNSIMTLPVNKFVVTLKQVPFYEGINKSIGENCFHFQNENNKTCMPEMSSKKEYDLVSMPINPDTITEMKISDVEINKEEIKAGDYVKITASIQELTSIHISELSAKELISWEMILVDSVKKNMYVNDIYKHSDVLIFSGEHWHVPTFFVKKVSP